MTSLTDTTASFGSLHFGEAQLGDVRRTRRLVRAADAIVQHPGGTLPQKLQDPYPLDVRHDNRVSIADAVSRILGRRYLSRPTHLGSKDARDHRLLVKRRLTTKCPDQRAARLARQGEGYTA